MEKILLTLLKDARLGKQSKYCHCDYEKLFSLSQMHQVSALIYNQIYWFEDFPKELKQKWRQVAIQINVAQTIKTQCFLKVYQQLINEGLKVAVVKGIVCRSLYPLPDNRESSDEDLFVVKEDILQATKILQQAGMQIISKANDVTIFIDPFSKLKIELHIFLFEDQNDYFYKFQNIFASSMNSLITHNIQEVPIYSFSHEDHYLFLIFHFVKHFLHGGVGIRQLVDIIMYVEKYGLEMNWDDIWKIQKKLQIDTIVMNLMMIGYNYLDFDIRKMKFDENMLHACDYDDLLEDIMGAGIFGSSTKERLHSSTMTLNALKNGKTSILKSIFPSLPEMKAKYNYLNQKPYLLPISYISRIIKYIKNSDDTIGKKTVQIGKQRIRLLKKYKIITK